jgi:hypothetical protein
MDVINLMLSDFCLKPLDRTRGSLRLPGRLIGVSRVLLRAPRTLSKEFNIDGLFQCFVLCFNRFCAFQAMACTADYVLSQRRCRCAVLRAGNR